MEIKSTRQILEEQKNTFTYKLIFNRWAKIFYWGIPSFFLLLFTILGAVLISQTAKALLITGIVFIVLSIVMIIVFFILNYYYKKNKYKVEALFTLDLLINQSLIEQGAIVEPFEETEIYDRFYISYYHHSLSTFKETKYQSKTYATTIDQKSLLIRMSIIDDYNEDKIILSNHQKHTQIYFQFPNTINTKIVVTEKEIREHMVNNMQMEKYNDNLFIYYSPKTTDEEKRTLEKILEILSPLNLHYELFINDHLLNLFILEDNYFLDLNFKDKQVDWDVITKDQNKLANIIKAIKAF